MRSLRMRRHQYGSVMSAKRELGRQIKAAMERLGWDPTGSELARRYQSKFPEGITEQTANAWLGGRRLPNALHLEELSELLDASLKVGGKETRKNAVSEPRLSWPVDFDASERNLMLVFRSLAPRPRELLVELMVAMGESGNGQA